MNRTRIFCATAVVGALTFAVTGCNRNKNPDSASATLASAPAPPPKPAPPPETELKANKVNEIGMIPVLEYHDIKGEKNDKMTRSVKSFRADLDRLYRENYRPILMKDYLDNRIDLPIGKSPVILTFDDSRLSQFRYLPDGKIDPDCAVGILQEFAKSHPDFPVKAMFFALPKRLFDQSATRDQKVSELLAMGCEFGNHTVKHPNLKRLSDARVQEEIGLAAKLLHEAAPTATIDTLAMPGGVPARNSALMLAGTYDGFAYKNRAAFLAGAAPCLPVVHVKYNPVRIPRILCYDVPEGLTDWLNKLKDGTYTRYVSDGDPDTVTVPASSAKKVDKKRLGTRTLRTYGGPPAPVTKK